jgi:hypothetical protein
MSISSIRARARMESYTASNFHTLRSFEHILRRACVILNMFIVSQFLTRWSLQAAQLLGAFAKLRKPTISSVHVEQLGSHWMDLYEI